MSEDGNAITPEKMCSEKFNSTDADVVFKSCDEVIFKIHRKNLEACTGGFPPSGFETLGEIVPLTEPSSILELLPRLTYPIPQPDIRSSSFETIAAVAEAAEKYQIYPAIPICTLIMEMSLPDNALKVFAHAGRHGHKALLGKAAPYLTGTPLDEITSELPGHLVVPWALKNLTAVFGETSKHDKSPLPTYLRAWRAMIELNIQEMESFDTYLP